MRRDRIMNGCVLATVLAWTATGCGADFGEAADQIATDPETGTSQQAETIAAVMCQHDNYRGYQVTLPVGDFKKEELGRRGIANDDLSSALVQTGYTAVLFEHDDFSFGRFGKFMSLTTSTPSFSPLGFNDITSSIVVVPSANHLIYIKYGTSARYTLRLLVADTRVTETTWSRLTNCWSTYSMMAERFPNPNLPLDLLLVVGPNDLNNYGRARVHMNSNGLVSNPWGADIMTHEQFHAIEEGYRNAPKWVKEGLADYARYKYGIYNILGGWSLPNPPNLGHYTDGYGNTARFFVWLEKWRRASFPTDLHSACLSGYTSSFWSNKFSGKTVDQLWADYVANPTLY
jgi:hypothetical protein